MRSGFAGAGLAGLALLLCMGCGSEPAAAPAQPAGPTADDLVSDAPHDRAVVTIRDLGDIHIELLPELAPKTVENFEKLAREGFYDGTSFHRVIPGFMIQGGDPNSRDPDPRNDGEGTPGYYIEDEFNEMPHERGVVSMANKGSHNSAGSQFFIMHGDHRSLDGKYTAFGRVVGGMDVVDRITQLEIDKYGRYGPRDRPYPVQAVVESVRIEPAGEETAAR